ncbi:MAG: hypothetical protein N4A74_01560 [Carboxylicivirga sp.]|jgi:hypothetical protein|nr:hypothetical protein [Carboxylicivirga sp.]
MKDKIIGYLITFCVMITIVIVSSLVVGLEEIGAGEFDSIKYAAGILITGAVMVIAFLIITEEYIKPSLYNYKINRILKSPQTISQNKKSPILQSGFYKEFEFAFFIVRQPFRLPSYNLAIRFNELKDKAELHDLTIRYPQYKWLSNYASKVIVDYHYSNKRSELDDLMNIIQNEKIIEQNANNG